MTCKVVFKRMSEIVAIVSKSGDRRDLEKWGQIVASKQAPLEGHDIAEIQFFDRARRQWVAWERYGGRND